MSYIRVLQARTAAPSIRIPHEPQIIIRQLLRYASEPSCRSLTMSRQSRRVASSGASNSYSLRARSPVDESYRQIFRATCKSVLLPALMTVPGESLQRQTEHLASEAL